MALHPFAIVRLVIFGVLIFFSFICLGLAGNLTSKTDGWTFPGFAVAVSVLTLVTLIPMLIIDMIRRGSFISWVAVELAVFGVLWVLWLASASLSTSTFLFTGDCDIWVPSIASLCRQYSALQAFMWIGWLIIKAYIILVLVCAILAMTRGRNKRVWLSPASDLSFTGTHTASGEPKIPPTNYSGTPYQSPSPAGPYPPGQGGYQQPPPMQQQQGIPHGYQQQGYIPPHQSPGPGVAQV